MWTSHSLPTAISPRTSNTVHTSTAWTLGERYLTPDTLCFPSTHIKGQRIYTGKCSLPCSGESEMFASREWANVLLFYLRHHHWQQLREMRRSIELWFFGDGEWNFCLFCLWEKNRKTWTTQITRCLPEDTRQLPEYCGILVQDRNPVTWVNI